MANVLSRKFARLVGTTPVQVGNYETPSNAIDAVVEWNLVNRTSGIIKVSAFIRDAGGNDTYKCYQTSVVPGEALSLISKLHVMAAGDKPFVVSDTALSLDCEIHHVTMA